MGPCCEQTHAAFEVGLNLDQGQSVYSGWSDVDGSSQLRLCNTCTIDVMSWASSGSHFERERDVYAVTQKSLHFHKTGYYLELLNMYNGDLSISMKTNYHICITKYLNRYERIKKPLSLKSPHKYTFPFNSGAWFSAQLVAPYYPH